MDIGRARQWVSRWDAQQQGYLLREHVCALSAAGFTEIGTLWQLGDDRILAAVVGG